MRNPKKSLKIGDVAIRYGVTQRSLRFYEQRGLLQPTKGSHDRAYSRKDEIRLQLIIKGKRLGMSLREIGDIIGYVDQRGASHTDLSLNADILKLMDKEAIVRLLGELCRHRADLNQSIKELETALASLG